jgi:hypothetical protein
VARKAQTSKVQTSELDQPSARNEDEFFRERSRRAELAEVGRILQRAGKGNPPVPGDEMETDR